MGNRTNTSNHEKENVEIADNKPETLTTEPAGATVQTENTELEETFDPFEPEPEGTVQAQKEPESALTERDFEREHKASITSAKAALDAQPKVRIYIPSDSQKRWEGNLNGLSLLIPTNKYVNVPRDVARLIANNTKVLVDSAKAMEKFNGSGPKVATL